MPLCTSKCAQVDRQGTSSFREGICDEAASEQADAPFQTSLQMSWWKYDKGAATASEQGEQFVYECKKERTEQNIKKKGCFSCLGDVIHRNLNCFMLVPQGDRELLELLRKMNGRNGCAATDLSQAER